MRKTGFFPRLALVNLARNGRFYGPYLLSCGAVAAMYYILRFLTWHPALADVRGAAYLQVMMSIGCFVVSLFSAVLLLYADSFVMKRRQRELGLYNVLGLEKRHIAAMCLWETLYCAAVSLAGGISAGVLLSRGMLWAVVRLLKLPVEIRFSVSGQGMAETALLFAVLFLLTLAVNLFRLGRSRPIELLRGGETGEREPKTKRLLAAVGLLALAAGYALAIVTKDPVEALAKFFLAVLLVMLGTYCLFTAGSIALLKRLRADRSFYYRPRRFTAVSGLLYRMKQNAVGLANICILSTMVLVTVSGTACLYLGMEDSLERMYPHDIQAIQDLDRQSGDPMETLRAVEAAAGASGLPVEYLGYYTRTSFTAYYGGNTLSPQPQGGVDRIQVTLLPLADYNRLTGRTAALEPDQVLAWSDGLALPERFYLEDRPLQIAERLENCPIQEGTALISGVKTLCLVLPEETLDWAAALAPEQSRDFRVHLDLDGTNAEKLACAEDLLSRSDGNFSVNSRQDNAQDYYAMYGGFLFTGLFLGALFLLATVLIIYYKQISEGYEDQRRYRIMSQVGMSPREIRASINSQILLVFFLPLAAAGLHILMAFQMLCPILELFGLNNVPLFALCTAGSLLVFCGIYALVFALTARTYGRIVGGGM